jgi:hypothetical protein
LAQNKEIKMFVEDTGGSAFKPVPAGNHLARCFRIVDLGTQKSSFEGQEKNLHKIKVYFEVHGDDENGLAMITAKNEPMTISKDYTLSWGEMATLRKDLQTWRGKPFSEEERKRFDLKNILGVFGMVNVVHKPKKSGSGVYANISSITPVPNAMKSLLPTGFNKCDMFQIDEPDMEMFNAFPPFLQVLIAASPEWNHRNNNVAHHAPKTSENSAPSAFDNDDSDAPF